jgi:hypothetical protein
VNCLPSKGCYHKIVNNFRLHYSGACFETDNSREQVENKVHDRVASLGEVLEIEARLLHSDESNLPGENDVVSFEGEIPVRIEIEK